MKHSLLKEPIRFLRSKAGKGAFVLAFFGFFVVAYAVTFPSDPQSPSGLIMNVVGLTVAQGDGSTPVGYAGADALCDSEFSGASLCSSEDVIHTLASGTPSPLDVATGNYWISSGLSSGPNVIANDCEGWMRAGTGQTMGGVFNTDQATFQIQDCRSTLSFACCR